MNFRLPNPASITYARNYAVTFGMCCGEVLMPSPWRLDDDSDTQHRTLACYACQTVYIDRRPATPSAIQPPNTPESPSKS